jgi:sigma-B regulation protein RsbU (phosphoserine phosphatase)
MSDDKSQESLAAEVKFLKSALHSLTEGVVVADRKGRFLYFNEVAQNILGMGALNVPPEQWPQRYGCYREDTVTLFPASELPLTRALAGKEVPETDIFVRNAQRAKGVWIRARAYPLRNEAGQAEGGIVLFRDITRRRAADAELQKLTNAVEQIADTILITNRDGVIEYANPASLQVTGYTREELLGHTPRLFNSGVHDARFYRRMWETLLSGQPFRATLLDRKKSGELYHAEQTVTPVRDSGGKITHFVSIIKDVTEQRKSQEREFQMSLARGVQQKFYDVATPRIEGFDIAGKSFPADATGGDYFDFVPLKEGSLGISIGDVSGHGISSALLMTELRAYLRAFTRKIQETNDLVEQLNGALIGDLEGGQFITLAFCHLDAVQRSLVYTSAGHVPIYLLNAQGDIHRVLESTDVPLGLFSGTKYGRSEPIAIEPGAILLMLTDGIAEAEGPDRESFGVGRILDYVRSHSSESALQIVSGLYGAVTDFCRESPPQDDLTVIVCKSIV